MLGKVYEDGLDKIRDMSPQHPEDIDVHFERTTQGEVTCRLSMKLLGKTIVSHATARKRLIAFHAAQRKLTNIIKKRKDALIGAKRKRIPVVETLKQVEEFND